MELIYVFLIIVAILGLFGGYVVYSRKKSPQEEIAVAAKSEEPKVQKDTPAPTVEVENSPLVIEAKARAKDIVVEARESALNIQSKAK